MRNRCRRQTIMHALQMQITMRHSRYRRPPPTCIIDTINQSSLCDGASASHVSAKVACSMEPDNHSSAEVKRPRPFDRVPLCKPNVIDAHFSLPFAPAKHPVLAPAVQSFAGA